MSQSSPGQRRQRNFRVDSGQGPACPSHTDTNSPALLTLGGDALHEHINDDDGARAADASAAETRYHHQRPGPPQEMVSLGGHPSTRQGVCVCVYRSLGQQRRNVPGSVPMLLPQSQDIQARVCFEVRTPFPSLQASVPHFLILPSLLPNIGYPCLLEKRDPQPATQDSSSLGSFRAGRALQAEAICSISGEQSSELPRPHPQPRSLWLGLSLSQSGSCLLSARRELSRSTAGWLPLGLGCPV